MKSTLIRSILMAAVLALLSARADAAVTVSISMFENDLDPYGSWVDVPSYGTCWHPSGVSAEWQPYTVGEWAYTDYDWTWVSHDRWGGLPYHYGTWVWVRGYGWVWIPGTVWAPAWVTWCYGDDYVGWAPIPPSINISYSGYFGSPVIVSQNSYVFVPTNQFVGREVSSIRVPSQRNPEIFRQSRQRTTSFAVSNGVLVNRGPSLQRIEQIAHTRIQRQNVSVARVAPTQISAGGAARGSRLGVIAPAPERARQFHAKMQNRAGNEGSAGAGAGGGGRAATGGEQHPMKTEHKAVHEEHVGQGGRGTAYEQHPQATEHRMKQNEHGAQGGSGAVHEQHSTGVQERQTLHQDHNTAQEHVSKPKGQQHPTVMEHHEAPPPHQAESQSPPPREMRHEAPPPHGGGQGNSSHSANTGGPEGHQHGGPPPGKQKQAPPKKQEPPPHT